MSYHIWEVVKQTGCTKAFPQLIRVIFLPIKVLTRRCYAVAGWEQVHEEGIQNPIFYGTKDHSFTCTAVAFILCIGVAEFYLMASPTLSSCIESSLWVSFTGILVFLPVCALLCTLLHHSGVTPRYVSFPLLLGLYLFTRIFLLVLAFAALRNLPHNALDKIEWPPFILIFTGN